MSAMAPSGVLNNCLSAELQRTLLTPSASPSVGPPDRPPAKRPRFRSTPSSSMSATPSMSNESVASADFNSARRASTLRVLNSWAQLAERYNKRLDEDDIVDLYSGTIIKDRGVLKGVPREYPIGHFAQPDGEQDLDADQDQEDSEQDEVENELSALPPSESTTDDDAPISKKELLRRVPPLSATTDAEDLREFLEAENRRRELAGDEDDEEEVPPEQLSAIRKALEEQSQKGEAVVANQAQDVASAEHPRENEADTTPTRPCTRVPPSDDESEDELALWTHDESTAIYPVSLHESEQGVRDVEQEVIELTESDSDEEFDAILTRPSRFAPVSPLPVPHPKEAQQPLQSPPDSERGRSDSRTRSHSKAKSAGVTLKPESRPRSPFVPGKPEAILTHKRKASVLRKTCTTTSDHGVSDQEVVGRIFPAQKPKDKEIPPLVEEGHREKTPKSLGVVSRGRKRKRIASATANGPLAQSPAEPKSSLRSHGKSTPQNSATLLQSDGPQLALYKNIDISTPVRFECSVAGPSRSLSSASKTQKPASSVPVCRTLDPESTQSISHGHNSERELLSDLPIPVTPYQRHTSHPPSIFSSPNQGAPRLSLLTHPSPPMDPVQTQQAHYLLAQAMHQLSYLISATMPPYAAYPSNPGQSWHPLPHVAYNAPMHHPPHFHDTRPYHTPSSSASHSNLLPSSPVQSPVSPLEEQRARSGRSRSRGRRVSFKLDNEQVIADREHNIQPEAHHSGQKIRKQSLDVKREKGKGKVIEEVDSSSRLEDRGSPPQEVARGRTPGPPSRKKNDATRGRPLSRR